MSLETEIFNNLMSRETTFTVNNMEFKENLISGTVKVRERKCKARAKKLVNIIEND